MSASTETQSTIHWEPNETPKEKMMIRDCRGRGLEWTHFEPTNVQNDSDMYVIPAPVLHVIRENVKIVVDSELSSIFPMELASNRAHFTSNDDCAKKLIAQAVV